MAAAEKVVVELTIDARGAQAGQAQFEAAMKKTEVVINGAASGVERSWNRIIGGLDPVAKAQIKAAEEIAKTAKITENAVKRGLATEEQAALIRAKNIQQQEQYVAAAKKAAGANDNIAKSAGLARHEMVNFSRQIQDVGVSLASGQSPFTVLVQQGTQVADIFASSNSTMRGFFQQIGAGVSRFIFSPFGLVAGLTAAGAAAAYLASNFGSSQRELAGNLTGIGRGSGQTVGGLNRIAESVAGSSLLSRSEARSLAGGFAGTGRIDGGVLPGLVGASRAFGIQTGIDTAEAGRVLAAAFADPARGAETLNEKLGFLNDRTREYIRNAVAVGDRAGAQKALFDAMNPTLATAEVRVTALGRAWERTSKFISDAADAAGRANLRSLAGPTLDEQIAELQRRRGGFSWRGSNDAAIDAQLGPLLRQRAQNRENASFSASERAADDLSIRAGDIVRGLNPDAGRLLGLSQQRSIIEQVLGDPAALAKFKGSANDLREALERIDGQMKSAADRAREQGEIEVQSINAYTLAERAAVEVRRAQTAAINDGRGAAVAAVEAENARNRAIAEANRQLKDSARDLRDQGSLVGRYGLDRTLQEITNRYQRMREQLGPGAANDNAPGRSAGVERILDAIERFESGGRNVPNYKFGPGYTAQGHFQITNTTWRGIASAAGIDLGQYPNAMSAPYDVQRNAARALIARNGVSDWAPYNPRFKAWYEGGGAGAGGAGMSIDAQEAEAKRQATISAQKDPLREATVALDAQIAAQRAAMGVFGQTTAQIVAQAESVRLLNEYSRANVPVTEDMRTEIDAYAQRAGAAAQANQTLGESMRQVSDWNSALADGVKGLVHDFRAGKSAGEAFGNMLSRLADRGIDSLINMVFGAGGAQGGLLGSLLGGSLLPKPGAIFANGGIMTPFGSMPLNRYATGGIANSPQVAIFGEGRQNEAFVPLPDGRSIPVSMRMPANNNYSGGNVNIDARTTINVPQGTNDAMMASFQRQLVEQKQDIAKIVREGRRSSSMQQTGVARG